MNRELFPRRNENFMPRERRQASHLRVDREVAGTHTQRLHNMTTPGDPAHLLPEVRVEHGGVYVLSHLPRHGAETYVGADLRLLRRAAEEVRTLLPDRYRSRVTAALVLPTPPAQIDRPDVAASVGGVLVLDAASLAHAVRCATPTLSTSEVSAVERLLRRQLRPVAAPTGGRHRRRHLPRLRATRVHLVGAA